MEEVKVPQVVAPVTVPPKKESSNVLICIYLMYNTNMITRHQLANMLQIIEKPFPEDMAKWLVGESKK